MYVDSMEIINDILYIFSSKILKKRISKNQEHVN